MTTPEEIARLVANATYQPNYAHKHKPRPGRQSASTSLKTDCDEAPVACPADARRLLIMAMRREMISSQWRGRWPQTVWAVDGCGVAYEAQLTNQATGEYHGYPIKKEDHFYSYIRSEWSERA